MKIPRHFLGAIAAAMIVLVALLIGTQWLRQRNTEPLSRTPATTRSNGSELTASMPVRPAAEQPDLADSIRISEELEATVAPSDDSVPLVESHGLVRFVAVDAKTRQALPFARARFRGQQQDVLTTLVRGNAVTASDLEGATAVPPGVADLEVNAPGYETAVRRGLLVRAGEQLDLGPIALSAGTSRIRGRVHAHGPLDETLVLQLAGEGRRPCEHCSARKSTEGPALFDEWWSGPKTVHGADPKTGCCPHCGYGVGRSLLQLANGAEFEFSNLSSGDYVLSLGADEGGGCGVQEGVRLRPYEDRWVELTLGTFVELVVELLGEDGRALIDGVLPTDPAADEFVRALAEVRAGTVLPHFTLLRDDRVVASTQLTPPQVSRLPSDSIAALLGLSTALEGTRDAPHAPPEPPSAQVAQLITALDVDRVDTNRFRIAFVPADVDEIVVSAPPYFSERTTLDLRGLRQSSVTIRLVPQRHAQTIECGANGELYASNGAGLWLEYASGPLTFGQDFARHLGH